MYRTLAKYYDAIYHWKDYEKEVKEIFEYIFKYKLSEGNELLDVACGTGSHLKYLSEKFQCTGIDLNSGILDVARKKLPKIEFIEADMSGFNLEKQFDVITCLFSSIGYILTKENLARTFLQFANHLKKGGVLLVEPWLTKDIYRTGSPHMTTYESNDLKIARLNISELKGDISYFEMHYLIAEREKKVKHFVDKHELAMFPIELLIDMMKENGFKTKFIKEGIFDDRGLLIGVKE